MKDTFIYFLTFDFTVVRTTGFDHMPQTDLLSHNGSNILQENLSTKFIYVTFLKYSNNWKIYNIRYSSGVEKETDLYSIIEVLTTTKATYILQINIRMS